MCFYLRFLGIYSKDECSEKLRWLLGRLVLLLAEDGRKPTTIKVQLITICIHSEITLLDLFQGATKENVKRKTSLHICLKELQINPLGTVRLIFR